MTEGNPQLLVQLPGGARPPMAMDCGVNGSQFSSELGALGFRIERTGDASALGAAGAYETWPTHGAPPLVNGTTRRNAVKPTIYQAAATPQQPDSLGSFGILGIDFLIGRRIVIDRPHRTLAFDRTAQLPPWSIGAHRTLELLGSYYRGPVTVREQVAARSGDTIMLDVDIDAPHRQQAFRVQLTDSWDHRGTWLVTRPVTAYWNRDGGAPGPWTSPGSHPGVAVRLHAISPHRR